MTVLQSVSNQKIKDAVKVSRSSKFRKSCGLFFLEGLRLCRDAAITGIEIERFFFTVEAMEKHLGDVNFIKEKAGESLCVGEAVAQKLCETDSSQGFFCLCRMNDSLKTKLKSGKKYIALENVQDPSNLGAISRTAEALGIEALIIQSGCDVYNPKAQRSAMGSLLRLPIIKTDSLEAFLKSAKESGFKAFATTPKSDVPPITDTDFSGGVICVIGNEGNGVSEKVFALCERITIPMAGRAESFNASAAAAITMWEMMRSGESNG